MAKERDKDELWQLHSEIHDVVMKLIEKGHDPLAIAGTLLAGAVQIYKLELGEERTSEMLSVISENHDMLNEVEEDTYH